MAGASQARFRLHWNRCSSGALILSNEMSDAIGLVTGVYLPLTIPLADFIMSLTFRTLRRAHTNSVARMIRPKGITNKPGPGKTSIAAPSKMTVVPMTPTSTRRKTGGKALRPSSSLASRHGCFECATHFSRSQSRFNPLASEVGVLQPSATPQHAFFRGRRKRDCVGSFLKNAMNPRGCVRMITCLKKAGARPAWNAGRVGIPGRFAAYAETPGRRARGPYHRGADPALKPGRCTARICKARERAGFVRAGD